jgi:hypothetical protein
MSCIGHGLDGLARPSAVPTIFSPAMCWAGNVWSGHGLGWSRSGLFMGWAGHGLELAKGCSDHGLC